MDCWRPPHASRLPYAASADIILSCDDFENDPRAEWGKERGKWYGTAGGACNAANPTNNPAAYTSVTTLPSLTDFRAEVDVLASGLGGVVAGRRPRP